MKVLIIGNGIAGMSAAIEAAELDDEVILVSPIQSERTQSVMAAEGINAVVDTAEEDSVVWHANDTLESGCFLEKEEDVRNLCEKAPEHLKWLDEMGVLFDRNEDDTWKVKASGGQSRKRTVYSGNSIGKQIVTAMTQKCLEYENWRLITQRISGIVILILLYPHMRVLHLIISGASFSGGAKFLVLVTEILFAGAAFLHLSVSFSRSMLTLGLLKNDRMEKLVDYVTWIICGLLMVLTVAARIRL